MAKRSSDPPSPPPPAKKPNQNKVFITKRMTPNKSHQDQHHYRILHLSNGMVVFLVSRKDPMSHQRQGYPGSGNRRRQPLQPRRHLFSSSRLTHFGFHSKGGNMYPSHHLISSIDTFGGGDADDYGYEMSTDISDVGRGNNNNNFRPEAQKTSVALAVSVGSIDDPRQHQGLAHFMEHMVHYGSKNFPEKNTDAFLVSVFKNYNAVTMLQTTSYYNQVPDIILSKNLEVNGDMLVEPLFCPNMLAKEVNAVDSEFHLQLPLRKLLLLFPYLALENTEHPLANFSCGNLETLTSCQGNDGDTMHEAMREHHETFYVPSAMTACLNSTKDIEDLENLAVQYFASFKEGVEAEQHQTLRQVKAEKLPALKIPKTAGRYYHIYFDGEFKTGNSLLLCWLLDASIGLENRQAKTYEMMEALLGDTSEGSLLHSLRKQKLATNSNIQMERTRYATEIIFWIELTKKGSEETAAVINEAFAFINFLCKNEDEDLHQRTMQRYFQEVKVAQLRDFHFGDNHANVELTNHYALTLQYEDPEDILTVNSWKNAEFNYESITNAFLQMLKPGNFTVIEPLSTDVKLESKASSEQCKVETAPYTKARFLRVEKTLPGGKSTSQFALPARNCFIESADEGGAGDGSSGVVAAPYREMKNVGDILPQRWRFRSKMDPAEDRSAVPKIFGIHYGHDEVSDDRYTGEAALLFSSILKQNLTPCSLALGFIWSRVIYDKLLSKASDFSLGGYDFVISNRMDIFIRGFPSHFVDVAGIVVKGMLDSVVTQEEFDLVKEALLVSAENNTSEQSFVSNNIIESLPLSATQPAATSAYDFLGELERLTLDDLNGLIYAFRQSSSCVVILDGNLSQDTFLDIAVILEEMDFGPRLNNNPLKITPVAPSRGIFKPGESCMRVKSIHNSDYTTSVTNLYVLPRQLVGDQKRFFLLLKLMRIHAFQYLRTENQLGYVVYVEPRFTDIRFSSILAFSLTVISTAAKFTPCKIDEKIDEFLSKFGDSLREMDDQILDTFKRLNPGFDDSVTKENLGDWVDSKFGIGFANDDHPSFNKCTLRGIQKLSVQILPGNKNADPMVCYCERCRSINEWIPGKSLNSTVEFARASQGAGRDYFVDSLIR